MLTHYGREQPGWDTSVAWPEALAGLGPRAIARDHAWLDDTDPPSLEHRRGAAVMVLPRH